MIRIIWPLWLDVNLSQRSFLDNGSPLYIIISEERCRNNGLFFYPAENGEKMVSRHPEMSPDLDLPLISINHILWIITEPGYWYISAPERYVSAGFVSLLSCPYIF